MYQSQNKIKLLSHYLVCLYLLASDFRLSGVTLHSITIFYIKNNKDHKCLFKFTISLALKTKDLPLKAGSKLKESDLSFCLIEWINISKGAIVILMNFYGLFFWLLKNYFLFRKVLDRKLCKGAKIGKVWGRSYIRFQRPWENIYGATIV